MVRRYTPNPRAKLVFVAVLVMWVVVPFAMQSRNAQDAIPFVTAGRLATSHPQDVYEPKMRSLYDVSPRFGRTSCSLSPAGTDCANVTVGYVSTPQALPLSWLLGHLGSTIGVLFMRLLAALSLSGGMWLIWQKLATRTRNAGVAVAATAVALTPMVMVPLGLGQNAPLLFLSACLGMSGTERNQKLAALVALIWVANVSFKAFPAALLLVLLWQRRGKVIAWGLAFGAALSALAALLGPKSWYTDFGHASRAISGFASSNRYNGSVEAALHSVSHSIVGSSAFGPAYVLIRVAVVGGLWWWRVRHADPDTQWAWASVAALLIAPLLWWHYLFVGVAAVAMALAGRRRLVDRLVWTLPALALVSALISISYIKDHPLPVVQALFALVCLVGVAFLVHGEARPLSAPSRQEQQVPPQPAPADR